MEYILNGTSMIWDFDKYETDPAKFKPDNLYIEGMWNMRDTVGHSDVCVNVFQDFSDTFCFLTLSNDLYAMRWDGKAMECFGHTCLPPDDFQDVGQLWRREEKVYEVDGKKLVWAVNRTEPDAPLLKNNANNLYIEGFWNMRDSIFDTDVCVDLRIFPGGRIYFSTLFGRVCCLKFDDTVPQQHIYSLQNPFRGIRRVAFSAAKYYIYGLQEPLTRRQRIKFDIAGDTIFDLKGKKLTWEGGWRTDKRLEENNLYLEQIWNMKGTVWRSQICIGVQFLTPEIFLFMTDVGNKFLMRYDGEQMVFLKKETHRFG